MDGEGPITLDQLADKTGLEPKCLREWLGSVSAAGNAVFDPAAQTFELPPDHGLVFAREGLPACIFYGFPCTFGVPASLAQPRGHARVPKRGSQSRPRCSVRGLSQRSPCDRDAGNMALEAKP
jgi:hypothetical protein